MTLRPRYIPVLLVSGGGLIKSQGFSTRRYIGDPLNAARIFSDLAADELIVLDIDARSESRSIDPALVASIADQIMMPLAAGGGISSLDEAESIIAAGAEKVVLSSGAWEDPYLITEVADHLGSSAVTVCVDVREVGPGDYRVYTHSGTVAAGVSPEDFARLAAEHGAGEIVIQSIDRDGEMCGYDNRLIASVARCVDLPVVGLGGAGAYSHLKEATDAGQASAAAAGSLFVYRSRAKGVLINYPAGTELEA